MVSSLIFFRFVSRPLSSSTNGSTFLQGYLGRYSIPPNNLLELHTLLNILMGQQRIFRTAHFPVSAILSGDVNRVKQEHRSQIFPESPGIWGRVLFFAHVYLH